MVRTSISAAEKFEQNLQQNLKVGRSIGVNVLDEEYRLGGRTMFTILTALTAFSMAIYAIWKIRVDFLKVMEVVGYLMIIIQGAQELWGRTMKPARYRVLFEKSRKLFEHLNENEENAQVLYDALQHTLTLQRMLIYWYNVMYTVVISITIVISFFGDKMLPMPLLFPGIDESTTAGFIVLSIVHLVEMIVGNRGYISFDSHFLYMVFPISGYVNAIEAEINKLNSMLNDSTCNESAISAQFLRICTLHRMLDEYEITLENDYLVTNLIKIGSAVFGLVSCLLLVFVSDCVQAYLTMGLFFTQVTQYCLMGTIITVKVRINSNLD